MSTARLHGADHRVLGEIASIAEGGAAIALSRGGAPKRYAHADPNEDAAGFAVSAWGAVAVIADAHAGHQAARAVVDRVLDVHVPRWLAAAPIALEARFTREAVEVAADLNLAILQAAARNGQGDSRTTVAVALVRPRDGWLGVLSVGDSHVFVCDGEKAVEVAAGKRDTPVYLGAPAHTPEQIAPHVRADVLPLGAAVAVVLATDGISEEGIGVADPAAAVAELVRAAAASAPPVRALEVARRLARTALDAHREQSSGDNIAAAALWIA
jgi:serine/threonine protein phosphatase PrpC